MAKSFVWNDVENLQCPPISRCPFSGDKGSVEVFTDKVSRIETFLLKEPYLRFEQAVLTRVLYKWSASLRRNKFYQYLKMVEKSLRRLARLELTTAVTHVCRCCPSFMEVSRAGTTVLMPSRQLVEFLLVKLLGAAELTKRTVSLCTKTFILVAQQIARSLFLRANCTLLSITSRLWALVKGFQEKLVKWYSLIRPWRETLQGTQVQWLPEGVELPADIAELLAPDEDTTQQQSRIQTSVSSMTPKALGFLDHLFTSPVPSPNDREHPPDPEASTGVDTPASEQPVQFKDKVAPIAHSTPVYSSPFPHAEDGLPSDLDMDLGESVPPIASYIRSRLSSDFQENAVVQPTRLNFAEEDEDEKQLSLSMTEVPMKRKRKRKRQTKKKVDMVIENLAEVSRPDSEIENLEEVLHPSKKRKKNGEAEVEEEGKSKVTTASFVNGKERKTEVDHVQETKCKKRKVQIAQETEDGQREKLANLPTNKATSSQKKGKKNRDTEVMKETETKEASRNLVNRKEKKAEGDHVQETKPFKGKIQIAKGTDHAHKEEDTYLPTTEGTSAQKKRKKNREMKEKKRVKAEGTERNLGKGNKRKAVGEHVQETDSTQEERVADLPTDQGSSIQKKRKNNKDKKVETKGIGRNPVKGVKRTAEGDPVQETRQKRRKLQLREETEDAQKEKVANLPSDKDICNLRKRKKNRDVKVKKEFETNRMGLSLVKGKKRKAGGDLVPETQQRKRKLQLTEETDGQKERVAELTTNKDMSGQKTRKKKGKAKASRGAEKRLQKSVNSETMSTGPEGEPLHKIEANGGRACTEKAREWTEDGILRIGSSESFQELYKSCQMMTEKVKGEVGTGKLRKLCVHIKKCAKREKMGGEVKSDLKQLRTQARRLVQVIGTAKQGPSGTQERRLGRELGNLKEANFQNTLDSSLKGKKKATRQKLSLEATTNSEPSSVKGESPVSGVSHRSQAGRVHGTAMVKKGKRTVGTVMGSSKGTHAILSTENAKVSSVMNNKPKQAKTKVKSSKKDIVKKQKKIAGKGGVKKVKKVKKLGANIFAKDEVLLKKQVNSFNDTDEIDDIFQGLD